MASWNTGYPALHVRAVNGDKSFFRPWHQKFTSASGQVPGEHEEIVHRLAKEIDLVRERENVLAGLSGECGDELDKISGDIWNMLIDKAGAEAYDKIKNCTQRSRSSLLYRWFTDVSGLGLA